MLEHMSADEHQPGYQPGFKVEDYDEFRAIARDLGRETGVFDANDATFAIASARAARLPWGAPLLNIADVITLLGDMEDLGYIRSVSRDPPGGPARWEYVEGNS